MDPRGADLARTAGVRIDRSRSRRERVGLGAVAAGTPAAVAARSVPGRPGLSILPLDRGPDRNRSPVPDPRGLDRLDWSGPVVLDAPAGAGRPAARALRAADNAMLVATPDPAALRSAARTAAMCDALGTPTAGAVLTRCPEPFDVEPLLGCSTAAAVPPSERPLADDTVAATFDGLVDRTK